MTHGMNRNIGGASASEKVDLESEGHSIDNLWFPYLEHLWDGGKMCCGLRPLRPPGDVQLTPGAKMRPVPVFRRPGRRDADSNKDWDPLEAALSSECEARGRCPYRVRREAASSVMVEVLQRHLEVCPVGMSPSSSLPPSLSSSLSSPSLLSSSSREVPERRMELWNSGSCNGPASNLSLSGKRFVQAEELEGAERPSPAGQLQSHGEPKLGTCKDPHLPETVAPTSVAESDSHGCREKPHAALHADEQAGLVTKNHASSQSPHDANEFQKTYSHVRKSSPTPRRSGKWRQVFSSFRGWIPSMPAASVRKNRRVRQHAGLELSQGFSLSKDFRLGETIGLGSYGRVFTARHSASGQIVAVKEMVINQSDSEAGRLAREISICEQLDHPRIVRYLGHEFVWSLTGGPQRVLLVLEYCTGGSVALHLSNYGPLEVHLMSKYAQQLLEGLCYLHSQSPPIVHRDLKCANLLLTHVPDLKISDFGCSKCLASSDLLSEGGHTVVGTMFWMAPEVLRSNYNLTTRVDIWSLGCCMIEMATASKPWSERNFDNIFSAYRTIAETEKLPAVPSFLPLAATNFVEKCLQRDPAARPSASDLQNHAFLVQAQP